jgi:DNA-binding NarL/FixJ family response regulator
MWPASRRQCRGVLLRFAHSIPVLKSIISASVKGEEVSSLMNKQIADELSIGEVTVTMHRGSTMRKLSAKSVARQDLQVQKIVNASSKEVEHEIKRL